VVRVCSVGDGPGYDHIALTIVSHFMHQVHCPTIFDGGGDGGGGGGPSLRPTPIITQAFDLFDRDWDPVKKTLDRCYSLALSNTLVTSPNDDDDDICEGGRTETPIDRPSSPQNDSINTVPAGGRTTLHHCDIRLSLDDPANVRLKNALPHADVLTFQYVLHENAAVLLSDTRRGSATVDPGTGNGDRDGNGGGDDEDERGDVDGDGDDIQEVVGDVLRRARVGTFLICTDSNNFVWPALKATAARHGWYFIGDLEKGREVTEANGGGGDGVGRAASSTISLGPKSFVLLERVTMTG